jgi:hypothetical protein
MTQNFVFIEITIAAKGLISVLQEKRINLHLFKDASCFVSRPCLIYCYAGKIKLSLGEAGKNSL